ncbi:hypothetical protein OIU77_005112 [Salix suchowensis]|uniref:Uncharacterized protein n=1 Tax=Salix suchowensis TaxID=1278906 RepID=A0ABQ9AP94_9ROSI|nr:hypothetical protein OIU77_005112 [Salix suchowensis]
MDTNSGRESGGIMPIVEVKELNGSSGKVFGEEEHGGMHIVGMHAHAAQHTHNHPHGQDACDGLVSSRDHGHEHGSGHGHGHEHGSAHGHGHGHGLGEGDVESGLRHVVVSQTIQDPVDCDNGVLFRHNDACRNRHWDSHFFILQSEQPESISC